MNDKVTGYRHDGDVQLDGRSIWHPSVELMALRRKVGMLFQRPNPFPMSIMDNVVSGVKAHRMASKSGLSEIAERRLTEVGLWDAVKDRLKDSPFRLSGGQQQLLCLARALAIDPEVLLAGRADLLARPGDHRVDRGPDQDACRPALTVVIVTHNLAQANRVSDRTIFLNDGRMVEHGEHQADVRQPGGGGDRSLRQRPLRLTKTTRHGRKRTPPAPGARTAQQRGTHRTQPRASRVAHA